jgi:uncharacterized protein YjiS (DUF1127 family)
VATDAGVPDAGAASVEAGAWLLGVVVAGADASAGLLAAAVPASSREHPVNAAAKPITSNRFFMNLLSSSCVQRQCRRVRRNLDE